MRRAVLVVLALALAAAAGCSDPEPSAAGAAKPAYGRSLIVLGIDGMDPSITRRLIARGELPNLAALAEHGTFGDLATTSPPQSPVAWSTFITGLPPSGHGIFDFVHRDPRTLEPYLSIARTHAADHEFEIGSFAFALGSPRVELLRKGEAFWQILERRGVPATVVKIPANYPPAPSTRAESMSGMGTPDLLGTYGTFQLVTDDPKFVGHTLNAGIVDAVDFAGGQRAHGALSGPPSPLHPDVHAMTLPLEIVRDQTRDVALIRLAGVDHVLAAGEWSDWIPVAFDPGLLGGDVPGMVRLYLRQVRPTFHLYVTPINVDPLDPALPLSSPPRYAAELARAVGRMYTQGMPEDSKALSGGALDDTEYLQIVGHVMDETEATLDRELDRFHGGFLFVYLSSIDQTSHMFHRSLEPDATPAERAHADVLPSLYRRVDRWIGEIRAREPDARLIVMSDHGFAPYRTKVNLNTFLAQRGYLSVLPVDQRKPGPLGHIDWSRTQAYALGLNEVFLNLRGREAHGVVDPARRDEVLARLRRDLLELRDPATGQTAVTRVDVIAPGKFPDRAPDLIIGYRRGYRSSDESALGAVRDTVFEPNHDHWNGDHCMDASAVPGVIATSAPIELASGRPGLIDLAPTILTYFGIAPPQDMVGHPLWPVAVEASHHPRSAGSADTALAR